MAVMEPADLRYHNDGSSGYSRDRSVIWRVFLEAKMRSAPMIILTVGSQDAPEMRLVQDDHVIEALSSD
jgi:hypothetical protein